MTRSERRLMFRTGLLGLLLTALIAVMDLTGAFEPFENFLYDTRAKYCQVYAKAPTTQLVHIDIDDPSLDYIGAWPWPRHRMAEVVDELRLAGLKTLAFDVIYSEPQELEYRPVAGAVSPQTRPSTRPVPAVPFDNDAVFAESLRRFGNALVPVSLTLAQHRARDPLQDALVSELFRDPELDQVTAVTRAAARYPGKEAAARAGTLFLAARDEAIYERISQEVREHPTFEALRPVILPRTPPTHTNSPALLALQKEYGRYHAVQALRRFARPKTGEFPPLLETRSEQATLERLSRAAATSGFVDYIPLSDGRVRVIPLFASHRNFVFPQIGLAMACAQLGVSPKDLVVTGESVTIPAGPGRDAIVIPTHERNVRGGRFGMFVDIPWFGDHSRNGTWQTMYDFKSHRTPKQHVPIRFVYEAVEVRRQIAGNNARAREWLLSLYEIAAEDRMRSLERFTFDAEEPEALIGELDAGLRIARENHEFYKAAELSTATPEERKQIELVLAAPGVLSQLREQLLSLKASLARRRGELAQIFRGNAAIVGWIAVGAIADHVPTPLHPTCPGVVAHGTLFNAIMTNDFWRRAHHGWTALFTVVMGVMTTATVVRLPAKWAFAACTLLGVAYLGLNGFVLFDKYNVIVGAAAPVMASIACWGGCTVAQYIQETTERKRVRQSFSNYVDPSLVEYVLDREDANVAGENKEISVVFTDLQGFTTMSEVLGPKAVEVLNEYMGLMVPIIRGHKAYLNKLLGDGIMYFFNAPKDLETHASAAIASALEMFPVMTAFNERLAARQLPPLSLRVGITSGEAIVGNAGPADKSFSDYTALGDIVNLAARLEAANKAFGTRILCNDRAHRLAEEDYLFRPIGKIQVAGKLELVTTFEPLNFAAKATDEQKHLADLTSRMVSAYFAGRFESSLRVIDELDQAFGPTRLTALYRRLCNQYLQQPREDFRGQIVLSEK